MKYFNAHAHIFNMQYTPENFLSFQLNPRVASIAHWILNKKWLATGLMWMLKPFLKSTGKKTMAFLAIGLKKSQDMIFEELVQQYPKSDDARFIVLPLNFQYMGAGKLGIPYEQQLVDLFEVKKKYPDKCYPFVAIDPRMGSGQSNREFVKKYIDQGFSGIKLYPAMGFFPYDARLKEVYEYAAANDIPLLTHCSRGGINYCSTDDMQSMEKPMSLNPVPGKLYDFPYDAKKSGGLGKYCDILNSPDQLDEVLQLIPNLKVCIAHLGMDSETKFANFNNQASHDFNWYGTILRLMSTYSNVYTDISYTLSYDEFYDWFLVEYSKMTDAVKSRVLFGTDFFMTVQEVHGNDNEIFSRAVDKLGPELFEKLAYTNVISFLNSKVGTYG